MSKKLESFGKVDEELQAKIATLEADNYSQGDIPGLEHGLVGRFLIEFRRELIDRMALGNMQSLRLLEPGQPTPIDAGVNLKHRYGAGNLLLQALLKNPNTRIYQEWTKHSILFPRSTITPTEVGRFRYAKVTIPTILDNMDVVYLHRNSGVHIEKGKITEGSYAMFPSLVEIVINSQPLS